MNSITHNIKQASCSYEYECIMHEQKIVQKKYQFKSLLFDQSNESQYSQHFFAAAYG